MDLSQLPTPSLLLDTKAFQHNVDTMAAALPGPKLRPHLKAFKSTAMAAALRDAGHHNFCAATTKELEGMANAGLGEDLLLANESLDVERLGRLGQLVASDKARITVAVDSDQTIAAAAQAGIREVLIDVNVGLPRCGCAPDDAGRLADLARSSGLEVRGVMGYEGHIMGEPDHDIRVSAVEISMEILVAAHNVVGGELISGGGSGTYAINTWANEIQAGSYVMMDTAYAKLGLPFEEALTVLGTVLSEGTSNGRRYLVADCGLKTLGLDHGNPDIDDAKVWFCSDEHLTFAPTGDRDWKIGDRVAIKPAHVDPTVARHEEYHLVTDGQVVDRWPIDLRHW